MWIFLDTVNLNVTQCLVNLGGKLTVYSPKDVTVKAANLRADIIHIQGNQVELGTVTTHNKQHYNGDADNYYRLDQTQEVGSQLTAKNDVNILSENLTALRQAGIHSDNGTVTLSSTNGDVQIQEGRHQEQLSFGAKSTHHGTLQTITSVTKHDHRYDSAQASAIDGNNVVLQANNGNVSVQGSNVVAENHLVAKAKNISIQAAENRVFEEDFEKTSKSGLMGSGGFGFSVGSKKEKVEQDRTQESAASSQVGSLKGNTTLHADNHYQQTGSVVTAVNGDVDILAKSADITAARSDYESNYKYTMEQKGVTIALTGAVAAAIQAVDSTVKSAKSVGSSKNNRVNAMAAANAGFEALRAGESLAALGKEAMTNGVGQAASSGVGVSITYGQQKTEQTQHSEGNTAEKSQVNAGGNVTITAQGKGEQSHLTIKGADVSGQGGTHLKAEGNVNILAADENHLERSKNKSSGFNVGVAIQIGGGLSAGITAGGNVAKGYGNGESQAWVASQVGSENSKTTIESGKDTNVIGSQVKGKRVEVSAENLNIESLQDTAKYEGKQESVSGQVTVGYGFSAGGSYSKSKVNSNYASVKTQAGIYAGDEGYGVDVRKHTELTGGLVTSTDKAETEGKNRFSTGTLNATDIENTSSSSADGFSLSGSATVSGGEAPKEVGGVKLKEIGENHKDGSSKVELGGVAGVASQGNWGITKGLVTGLFGQVHSSNNENGITTSAINTRNIVIRDENAQTQLGTSSAEMIAKVNKDNIHQSVNQVDGSQLQSEIERDLAISKSFVNNINDTGDEIYYKIEKKEDNIFVKEKRAKDCESIDCIKMSELDVETLEVPKTKEEAEKLARMYAHGIMNKNDEERLQGAIQYGGEDYLENDVLVVRKPYTSIAAELGFTVFERLRAGIDAPAIFGASNASREQAKIWGLLEEYNRNNPNAQVDLKHLSHSLGVSSTKNAMNWASYKGMQLNNTTLNANTVGTSYPMTNNTLGGRLSFGLYDQGYTEKASGLFRDGKVEYAVAPRDIVGTGVHLPWVPGAFSLGIGNTNTTGSNTTGIPLWGIFTGDHTKAYYKDERVINFLNTDKEGINRENIDKIKDYQKNTWGQIGPKTKVIKFNNKTLLNNEEGGK